MAKKYLIKHWVNADFILEKVVNEDEIDIKTNDMKNYKYPDGTFSAVMIQGSENIKRTSYEEYDESINISNKDRTSNK